MGERKIEPLENEVEEKSPRKILEVVLKFKEYIENIIYNGKNRS